MENFDLDSLKRFSDRLFSVAFMCVFLHMFLALVVGILLACITTSTEIVEVIFYTLLLVFWIYLGWFR